MAAWRPHSAWHAFATGKWRESHLLPEVTMKCHLMLEERNARLVLGPDNTEEVCGIGENTHGRLCGYLPPFVMPQHM